MPPSFVQCAMLSAQLNVFIAALKQSLSILAFGKFQVLKQEFLLE